MLVIKFIIISAILFSLGGIIYHLFFSECTEHDFVMTSSNASHDRYECQNRNCNTGKVVHHMPTLFMSLTDESDKPKSSGNEVM